MHPFHKVIKLISFQYDGGQGFNKKDLLWGLAITWLVGMGRYWDHPEAKLLQHLGVGSLVYVFFLAGFLYLLNRPLARKPISYFHILCFVSFTSLPAAFYAIPVEKFFSIPTAAMINVFFLFVVASWRVLLLAYFYRSFFEYSRLQTTVMVLLPLAIIVCLLALLNLEHATFHVMAGLQHQTAYDASYVVVLVLTVCSFFLIGPLMAGYGYLLLKSRKYSS